MNLRYIIHLSDDVREFIQGENYEETVLEYMNRSTVYFPNSYSHMPPKEQNNGQADYIDNDTKEEYDAKLLFSGEQCYALAQGPDHYKQWHKMVMDEVNEIVDCLRYNPTKIKESKLYKEVDKRINATKENEHVILFLPFPMDLANEPNAPMMARFASGALSYVIDSVIEESKLLKSKRVYSITPTIHGELVAIREYPGYAIPEHLPAGNLLNYLRYEIQLSASNED